MSSLKQNNTQLSQENKMSGLMEEVLALAKSKGATDAMVSIAHDQGFSVDVRKEAVETIAFHEDKQLSIVVYVGHRKGAASGNDLSSEALDSLVNAAYDIAVVSAEDPCFGLPDSNLISKTFPELDLYHPWSIDPSEAVSKALACESQALALDKKIVNSDGVSVSTYEFLRGFANTLGGLGISRGTRHSISCSLIAKEGKAMQRDYDYTTARHWQDLLSLEKLAESTVNRTVSRLGAKKIKTQKIPVLFSSRVSSSLLSSFIHAISGSQLYKKNSFLLDSLGKQIFPSFIKIYEQPHLQGAIGSSPFDSEGIETRPNIFIEEGHLCSYVLGTYSARKMGLKTTANSGGVYNLTVDPNAGDLPELLKMMGKGLIVTELMGQGVNGLTGDYSRGATGFWVENGKIQHAVEEITIAGNLKDMFLNIRAIGNDRNPNIATRCGSILIEEMMVAGD